MNKPHKYWVNSSAFANLLRILAIILLGLLILALVRQCQDCRRGDRVRTIVKDRTGGYDPADDSNPDVLPPVTPPYDENDSLPESVMLEHLFPPIGDQGSNGTCVVWATGYNLKTALNAKQRHWSSDSLASPSCQTSPADLWYAIPSSEKGAGCSGTGFGPALEALRTTGAASMVKVPYTSNFNPCAGNAQGDASNTIQSYAAISQSNGSLPSLHQLKAYIADSIPLALGIRCGDNFMTWDSDKVLQNETFRYTGMHAFHAIALVGYDDARQAFRLRNSWGKEWGDEGSIWIDYQLFLSQVCLSVVQEINQ